MNVENRNPKIAYERRDVGLRPPLLAALALSLVVIVSLGVLRWAYGDDLQHVHREDSHETQFTHGPDYTTPIAEDQAALRRDNAGRLVGLDAAFDQILARGLPVWKAPASTEPPDNPPPLEAREEALEDAQP